MNLLNKLSDITTYKMYKTIFNSIIESMLIMKITGEIIDCNEEALKEYGYTKEELLKLKVADLKANKENLYVESGKIFETVHLRKNGSFFPVEVRSFEIDEEQIVFYLIRNISDRRKKEIENNNLAAIVEASQDAIFIREMDGTIISWNKGAENMFGYEAEEIIGQKIYSIIPDRVIETVKADSQRLARGEFIDKFEGEFIKKNGSIVAGSIKVALLKTEENDNTLISLIVRDLTEDKKKTIEIEKLTLALEQASNGIVTTDLQGNIDYVNKKFEVLTGYSSDEIMGKNTSFLKSLSKEKDFFDNILEMIKVKNEFVGEFANENSNGGLIWIRASLSPIKEVDNSVIGFIAILDDVTEKKNLIDDLNRKNGELEDALKILKETQLKLISEDKMASIGQLSAGIAHEINNPLGFVLSNFSTLRKYVLKLKNTLVGYRNFKNNLNEKYSELENVKIEEIEDINKLDYILEDLNELFEETNDGLERIRNIVLALRKFARENIDGDFEEYDLNDGIKNTLIIARNEFKYNSEIVLNLGELPMINAIGSEINQVLLNMIVNSSQAIKEKIEKNNIKAEKYGEIIISSYCEKDFVCFAIQDNGIGIPETLINKVFEPFFTTKSVGKGTGLGLSISYEIIKNKHNGEIKIESKVNEGTKITIRLPA